MSWRWTTWFVGIFALGLIALFPLRLALGPIADRGFTARQVAGTIWYGRIGELMHRGRRLGTFEVRVAPLPLLVGSSRIRFSRMDDPEGPLDGVAAFGDTAGIADASGRIPAGRILGDLPLASIELADVTLLFKGERCAEAKGQVRVLLALPMPGDFGRQLSGTLRCERERARFRLADPSGNVALEFYVNRDGRYRAWLRLAGHPGDAGPALALSGFRISPGGLTLSADGRW